MIRLYYNMSSSITLHTIPYIIIHASKFLLSCSLPSILYTCGFLYIFLCISFKYPVLAAAPDIESLYKQFPHYFYIFYFKNISYYKLYIFIIILPYLPTEPSIHYLYDPRLLYLPCCVFSQPLYAHYFFYFLMFFFRNLLVLAASPDKLQSLYINIV